MQSYFDGDPVLVFSETVSYDLAQLLSPYISNIIN